MPKITPEEIHELIEAALPFAVDTGMTVEEIGKGTCRVRTSRCSRRSAGSRWR
jgi:hypothetical protein